MERMGDKGKWVLVLPFIAFSVAAWVFVRTENEVRVSFDRAREQWRQGSYVEAVRRFEELAKRYPHSKYRDDALWEIATIYYFNLSDPGRALTYFDKLASERPRSKLAAESCLRIAEIYQFEFNEISKAIEYWGRALRGDLTELQRDQINLRIADAYFKSGRIEEAFRVFTRLLESSRDRHTVEQCRLRIGAILQIRKDHEAAIDILERVLDSTSCPDCRLNAQLGLIESYEYLDNLSRAIEIARSIETQRYPPARKKALVERLSTKKKYYEPRPWSSN